MPFAVTSSLSEGVCLLRDGEPVARWVKPREMHTAWTALAAWGPEVPMQDGRIIRLSEAEYVELVAALVAAWADALRGG